MVFILAIFSLARVLDWMHRGGYFILFGLLFACGLGLPLPEDVPLLASGWLIARGHMDPWLAGLAAWLGIIGGDCVLYHLGKRYGLEITRVPFVGRHLTKARIERAEQLFARWGVWVVAFGRLFAGIRAAMVVAAGATRYSYAKFVVVDSIAALFSGALFVFLGWLVGRKMGDLNEAARRVASAEEWVFGVVIALGVLVGLYIWWRRRRPKVLADTDVAMERAAEPVASGAEAP